MCVCVCVCVCVYVYILLTCCYHIFFKLDYTDVVIILLYHLSTTTIP